MLAVGDAQRDVVEDDIVAAGNTHIAHEQKIGLCRVGQGGTSEKIIAEARIDTVEAAPDEPDHDEPDRTDFR